MTVAPSPVVALNRAVALAETTAPEPRWRSSMASTSIATISGTRSAPTLLKRIGRYQDAAAAYNAAIARTDNAAERAFLQRGRDTVRPQ